MADTSTHGSTHPRHPAKTFAGRLHAALDSLYNGRSRRAVHFRRWLLAFDVTLLCLFVVLTFFPPRPWMVWLDFALGVAVAADYLARLVIAENRRRYLLGPWGLADLIVIVSLFLPTITPSYLFLRVLRAIRLLRSYHVLHQMRAQSRFVRRNEEVIHSATNLLVFIFVVTAFVYVTQRSVNPAIKTYVDALYFTVTSLTTTGYGDITLAGTGGRMLSVLIMLFGISLFLRLAQTIFRPPRIHYECPDCGLNRHDPDAIHCKHCGRLLHIKREAE